MNKKTTGNQRYQNTQESSGALWWSENVPVKRTLAVRELSVRVRMNKGGTPTDMHTSLPAVYLISYYTYALDSSPFFFPGNEWANENDGLN